MVAAKTHQKWKTEAPGVRQPKFHVWAFFWVARGTSFLWRPSFPLPVFPSTSSRHCHVHGKLKHLLIFSSTENLPRPLGPTEKRKLILSLKFPTPRIISEGSPSCPFLENGFKNLNRHTNAYKIHPKLEMGVPSGRQPKFPVWAFFWVARGHISYGDHPSHCQSYT